MTNRILAFACGLLAGLALHAVFLSSLPDPASVASAPAPQAQGVPRCAAHPVKMPCLFDAGR